MNLHKVVKFGRFRSSRDRDTRPEPFSALIIYDASIVPKSKKF